MYLIIFCKVFQDWSCVLADSSIIITPYESLCADWNWSDMLLIQYRRPVGGGPSGNTWPRWESHWKTKWKKYITDIRSVISGNISLSMSLKVSVLVYVIGSRNKRLYFNYSKHNLIITVVFCFFLLTGCDTTTF